MTRDLNTPTKRHSPEGIININKLREADVVIVQHKTIAEVDKQLSVTDLTYYRLRKKVGSVMMDQAKHPNKLEADKASLMRYFGFGN